LADPEIAGDLVPQIRSLRAPHLVSHGKGVPVSVKSSSPSTPEHLKEFFAFLKELNRESERGAALIAASMIDDLLRRCLLAFFINHKAALKLLDGFNAPLGTLAARTRAAVCVGLLSESEYKECETIRAIRNKFAHNIHVRFSDKEIATLCSGLACRPSFRSS